jgi:hypothetical protein
VLVYYITLCANFEVRMNKFIKGLILATLTTVLLLNSSPIVAKPKKESPAVKFNEIVINFSYTMLHPVIAADLIAGNGKELIAIGKDENKKRWLVIYSLDTENDQYLEIVRTFIPKQFHSFDLSEYKQGQLQNLYFMSSRILAKFQLETLTEVNKFKTVAEIQSIILKNDHEDIQRGDFIQDLNDDALDDAMISNFYNINVLIGQIDGSLISQDLPIEPEVNVYSKSVSYQQTKLYLNDINFDNKVDIIKVGEGEMKIYHQLDKGKFEVQATLLNINESINRKDEDREIDDVSINSGSDYNRKLEELLDLNVDGITDMVVLYTKNSGVFDIENNYEIYLGKNIEGQLIYGEEPTSVIKADGTLMGLKFVDIDNDEKSEILTAGFEIGVFKIIDVLLTGDIDIDVYLFKMDLDGNFISKPIVSKDVELNFSLSSGQGSIPMFELADINGDGLKDLVLSDSEKELKIYHGQNSKRLYAKRGVKYKTQLPKNGQMVLVNDLNDDGKDDLLFKLPPKDEDSSGGNIKVLLSKGS